MQAAIKRYFIIIIVLIALGASSCDIGSSVFTEEELDAMYSVKLSQNSQSLASGSLIEAAKSIGVSISSINGAPEPTSMDITMTSSDGTEIASLTFAIKGSPIKGALEVKNFDDGIPPFMMPADVPDGYYSLGISLKNALGEALAQSATVILVFGSSLQVPSLAVYPGTVISGKVSLLKLEGAYPTGLDPWIRWSINGKVQLEGLLSSHADRLAWKAPSINGVYVAKAEIYPFIPPLGSAVPALVKAEIKLPVSTAITEIDPLSDLPAWSTLSLDGDFNDLGPRPRSGEPTAIGKPYLATYSSGFGYHLGSGAGILSHTSLLPVKNGLPIAFTAVFGMAPAFDGQESQSGRIFTCADTDKTASLSIGIDNGYPYVDSGKGKISATLPVPMGGYRLAVFIAPSSTGASVSFFIDEAPAGRGDIAASLFSNRPADTIIAGEDGYNAIYDDIRILSGPYPAFSIAAKSEKGRSLIAASAFEGGELGVPFETGGKVTISDGAIALSAEASLFVGEPGLPEAGSTLSFDVVSGEATVSVALADDVMLVIGYDGTVSIGDKKLGVRLDMLPKAKVSVTLEATKDGLHLFGASDEAIDITARLSADARWIISTLGDGPLVITKVMASTFEASIAELKRKAQPRTKDTYSPSTTKKAEEVTSMPSLQAYVSMIITE